MAKAKTKKASAKKASAKKKQPPKSIVAQYLDKIQGKIDKLGGGTDYAYRGQADVDWPLVNGAIRRIQNAIEYDNQPKLSVEQILDGVKKHIGNDDDLREFIKECEGIIGNNKVTNDDDWDFLQKLLLNYNRSLLSDSKKHEFRFMDGRKLTDLELLAQLQHFGAATLLLDFSKKALVALFNACREREGKDGKIFVVPYKKLKEIEIEIEGTKEDKSENKTLLVEDIINGNKPSYFDPIIHGQAKERMASQSGLFLINMPEKKERPTQWEEVRIDQRHKNDILKELRSMHDTSADTLFRDLPGFAQNNAQGRMLDNDWVYVVRGDNSLIKRNYDEAIEWYDTAIRINPGFCFAYLNRGNAKYLLTKYEDAIDDFDKAIGIDKDFSLAYSSRGAAKADLGNYEDAIDDCKKAIELSPNDAVAYYTLGRSEYFLKKHEDSIDNLNRAIKLDPDFAEAYSMIAATLRELERTEEARKNLEKAYSLASKQRKSTLAFQCFTRIVNLDQETKSDPEEGQRQKSLLSTQTNQATNPDPAEGG